MTDKTSKERGNHAPGGKMSKELEADLKKHKKDRENKEKKDKGDKSGSL